MVKSKYLMPNGGIVMHIALIHSEYQNVEESRVNQNPHGSKIMRNTVSAVKEALEVGGHKVSSIIATNNLLTTIEKLRPLDLLFNISTGILDKRSQANIVGLLEMSNLPMVGSGLATHVLALHKEVTKSLLKAHEIRTAHFQLISDENEKIREDFSYPLIVKPEHEGSGIGVTDNSLVDSPKQLKEVIKEKFALHKQVLLIEEFLPGREFTVGIIGNNTLEVLPIKETKFPKDDSQILTNQLKMDATSLSEIPANIPEKLSKEIKRMAEKTYRILRCQDFARIDFRLDKEGHPHVIELNTFPGLEKGFSFFPLIAEAAGYSYEELLNHLVEVALEPKGYQ